MDLAVYIGELLRQHGSLSVPGLGRFSQVSKEGYYAENEGRFYPPHHETGFEEQATTDETLANYLSSRKNISVNSAKYFIDKYISQLKQNAAANEVAMDQLGWMKFTEGHLQFRPNTASTTFEGEFFGLPSIQVNKIWEQLSGYKPPVVTDKATATPAAQSSSPAPTPELSIFPEVLDLASDNREPARREREPVKKQVPAASKQSAKATAATAAEPPAPKAVVNVWILVLVIVTLAGIILLALYNYKPALFSTRGSGNIHAPAGTRHTAADTVSAHQPDTIQTSLSTRTDTAGKAAAPVKDTVAATHLAPPVTKPAAPAADTATKAAAYVSPASQYQIAGGAFKTQKEVDQAIIAFRSMGITAHTLRPNRPGNKIKVTLGGFNTYQEAQARLNQLKAAHKTIKDAYIIRPNTK